MITSAYQAAEVAAMMVAPWFAVTFSLRRFTLAATLGFCLMAAIQPLVINTSGFIALRVIQGSLAAPSPHADDGCPALPAARH